MSARAAAFASLTLFLTASVAVIPAPSLAVEFAGEFLSLGFGARSLSVSGAMTSFCQGADAVYWNAARLAGNPHTEGMAMHSERFSGIVKYDNLGVALRSSGGDESGFGLGIIRVAVDEIPRTNGLGWLDHGADGVPGTGDSGEGDGEWSPGERVIYDESRIRYGTDEQLAVLIAYGRRFSDRVRLGITTKLARQSVGDLSSFGMGFDLASSIAISPTYELAIRVSDVGGTQLWWDSGSREVLRTAIWIGHSYRLNFAGLKSTLSVSQDLGFRDVGSAPAEDRAALSGGIEYSFADAVFARVGMGEDGFSAGGGLAVGRIRADYAYSGHAALGDTHRVGMTARIGD